MLIRFPKVYFSFQGWSKRRDGTKFRFPSIIIESVPFSKMGDAFIARDDFFRNPWLAYPKSRQGRANTDRISMNARGFRTDERRISVSRRDCLSFRANHLGNPAKTQRSAERRTRFVDRFETSIQDEPAKNLVEKPLLDSFRNLDWNKFAREIFRFIALLFLEKYK